jgi:trehalose 6-phosphate synthase/phosphatase
MAKHSFVTVSNRLPISVSKSEGELTYSVSSGGLATAMSSLDLPDSVWVGWCGIPSEDLSGKEKTEIKQKFAEHGSVPVFLTAQQVELYYEGYSNDTLWPLFHYFQSLAQYSGKYWQAYEEVNQAFLQTIKQVAKPTAKIWVHDYHLMLVPALVRRELPQSIIGFFLHIPFPSFEIFRLLPERKEVLEGLLGADIIGFHIYDYGRHFINSCERLLGLRSDSAELDYEGRIVRVSAYPIGIDYKKFELTARSAESKRIQKDLKKNLKTEHLILSVDRLDYSKGIPERLEAFRQLLENHPEYIGKIELMMIAVPSRTEVETYQKLRDLIEQTVSRINGAYGTSHWAPISYQFQNRPFEEVVALYDLADVMLVTPIRDGMNLVAKEYIASKQKHSGVLVLSEMAGAIDEMPEALSVNPNSAPSIMQALHNALEMPRKEQMQRIKTMQERLETYDVKAWGKSFIDDMYLAEAGGNRPADMRLGAEQYQSLVNDFTKSQRKLLILDYDGTLKPFHAKPTILAGFPSIRVRRLLKKLSLDESVTIAIVSGRPRKVLQIWFRGIKLELAAEHGAWTRYNGEWRKIDNTFRSVKKTVQEIMDQYVSRTEGSHVEEKDYSLVWHYRNVEPGLAYSRVSKLMHELSEALPGDEIQVHDGDKIVEVKPSVVSKGRVVEELLQAHEPDFILCAGDDYTDEDMFEALGSNGYTFKIGDGKTRAKFRFDSMSEIVDLLEDLSTHND